MQLLITIDYKRLSTVNSNANILTTVKLMKCVVNWENKEGVTSSSTKSNEYLSFYIITWMRCLMDNTAITEEFREEL
jgi:hypothetical protein